MDDQHAGRAEGREVDAGAARRVARCTTGRIRSASSRTATRTCSSCRPTAARARQLTTGKWSVGAGELRGGASIDWTPDSKSIVFDGNRSPDADMQYETSQIYVVDVASGAIRDLVTKPGDWGRPVVSPDGRTVAFTGYRADRDTRTRSATCS